MTSRKQAEETIRALGWWYQHFEFPNGAKTGPGKLPGYDAKGRWHYIASFVPKDLRGKTVLDIGGNAGYFSIQMKLRGAQRCVLVDPFEVAIRQAQFAAEQFQVQLEYVMEDAHVYCLTTDERFDYVIFLGLFYHLKYPGLVLDRLAEMTRERIFIHSDILDSQETSPARETFCSNASDQELLQRPDIPRLMFIEDLLNDDATNWWLPNTAGLAAMVRSSGLKIIDQPHPHIFIAEPEVYLGKTILPRLVFPCYGKKRGGVYPGRQKCAAAEWLETSRSLEETQWTSPRLLSTAWFASHLLKIVRRAWFVWVRVRGYAISHLRR
jgi:tRNA (mo5U34)-methyltransferase